MGLRRFRRSKKPASTGSIRYLDVYLDTSSAFSVRFACQNGEHINLNQSTWTRWPESQERLRRLESDTSVGMSKEVDRQRSNAEARGWGQQAGDGFTGFEKEQVSWDWGYHMWISACCSPIVVQADMIYCLYIYIYIECFWWAYTHTLVYTHTHICNMNYVSSLSISLSLSHSLDSVFFYHFLLNDSNFLQGEWRSACFARPAFQAVRHVMRPLTASGGNTVWFFFVVGLFLGLRFFLLLNLCLWLPVYLPGGERRSRIQKGFLKTAWS